MARELDALVRIYGKPVCIVSDNGTEFTSNAILKWATDNKVEWHYIDPGKPQQNGYIESFNGSLRDECLNEEIFDKPGRRPPNPGPLALRLQQRQAAFIARQQDPRRSAPSA